MDFPCSRTKPENRESADSHGGAITFTDQPASGSTTNCPASNNQRRASSLPATTRINNFTATTNLDSNSHDPPKLNNSDSFRVIQISAPRHNDSTRTASAQGTRTDTLDASPIPSSTLQSTPAPTRLSRFRLELCFVRTNRRSATRPSSSHSASPCEPIHRQSPYRVGQRHLLQQPCTPSSEQIEPNRDLPNQKEEKPDELGRAAY